MKNLNIFSLISEYDNAKSRGVLNEPNVSFINEDSSVKYFFDPYNGYEYVDLGLPSGLKWATCNVGAKRPTDYGLYFAWGETTGYTNDQILFGDKEFNSESYTASSISTNLTLSQDAAHIYMRGNWRMPTKDDWWELIDNCNAKWVNSYEGIGGKGVIFTSKTNNNSIFIPAAGFYYDSSASDIDSQVLCWSSSWYSDSKANNFNIDVEVLGTTDNLSRCYGLTVRGVCK